MAKYKDEFVFKLSKPIKYQKKTKVGSEFVETVELILKAPNLKSHYRIGNVLQALFTPAMLKSQKLMLDITDGKTQEKTEDISEEQANKILCNFTLLALGKDINDFYDAFEKLLVSGICFLDHDTQLDEMDLNSLYYNDFKELTSEYTANFFIASWMKSLGAN